MMLKSFKKGITDRPETALFLLVLPVYRRPMSISLVLKEFQTTHVDRID
jgi:hypothetical protein